MKTGLAVAAAVLVMAGCGNSSSEGSTTTAAVNAQTETTVAEASVQEAKGSVELGEYKGLTLTVKKKEVTSGQVEAQLHTYASEYPPEIYDRAAEIGDTANLDYEGMIDGESFAGSTAYADDLELGSGTFIAGFEDGIVGMMPGEEKDLNLKFPEDYYNSELAGKDVVFHVKLNYVTNPEAIAVDDALAQRIMFKEDATLEMLRAETREKLEIDAEVYYYLESAAELLGQVVENSEIEVDAKALKEMQDTLKTEYSAQAALYGMTYKDFLSVFLNTTPEQLESDAEISLKEEMVMNAILAAEKIEATEEQKTMIAKINGCDDVDHLISRYGEEQSEKMFGMYAGTYFLISNAVETE